MEPNSAVQPNTDLMQVQHLKKYFPVRAGIMQRVVAQVQAVDDVSFSIKKGETLGMVGESGCGKTTVGRTMLRLIEPTAGSVIYDGQDIFKLKNKEYKERVEIMMETLKKVGLEDYHSRRFPHEFSGGQRQRIGIARALALRPKFIVCDEPVSALDVSIQSQVLNILKDLQSEFGLTYLFIAHNLSVVEHISNRVAVMYLGKMVELADRDEMYRDPKHPYTQALLSAIPVPDPKLKRNRLILKGDVPSPLHPPSGCRFHPRCPIAQEICSKEEPVFREIKPDHWVDCWMAE